MAGEKTKRGAYQRGEMPVREAGRRGGLATLKRHGREHFVRIGRKGGESRHGKTQRRRSRKRRSA